MIGGALVTVAALYRPDEVEVRVLYAGADPDDVILRTVSQVDRHLLKPLGFVLSYALFTFFVVSAMYGRPLKNAALIAVASAAGFYLIFPTALGVTLPVGVFGF